MRAVCCCVALLVITAALADDAVWWMNTFDPEDSSSFVSDDLKTIARFSNDSVDAFVATDYFTVAGPSRRLVVFGVESRDDWLDNVESGVFGAGLWFPQEFQHFFPPILAVANASGNPALFALAFSEDYGVLQIGSVQSELYRGNITWTPVQTTCECADCIVCGMFSLSIQISSVHMDQTSYDTSAAVAIVASAERCLILPTQGAAGNVYAWFMAQLQLSASSPSLMIAGELFEIPRATLCVDTWSSEPTMFALGLSFLQHVVTVSDLRNMAQPHIGFAVRSDIPLRSITHNAAQQNITMLVLDRAASGLYYLNVSLGTPPQPLSLAVDTATGVLIIRALSRESIRQSKPLLVTMLCVLLIACVGGLVFLKKRGNPSSGHHVRAADDNEAATTTAVDSDDNDDDAVREQLTRRRSQEDYDIENEDVEAMRPLSRSSDISMEEMHSNALEHTTTTTTTTPRPVRPARLAQGGTYSPLTATDQS